MERTRQGYMERNNLRECPKADFRDMIPDSHHKRRDETNSGIPHDSVFDHTEMFIKNNNQLVLTSQPYFTDDIEQARLIVEAAGIARYYRLSVRVRHNQSWYDLSTVLIEFNAPKIWTGKSQVSRVEERAVRRYKDYVAIPTYPKGTPDLILIPKRMVSSVLLREVKSIKDSQKPHQLDILRQYEGQGFNAAFLHEKKDGEWEERRPWKESATSVEEKS